MRVKISSPLVLFILFSGSPAASNAQLVHGMYERAGTLAKGNVELSTQYSHHFAAVYGASGSVSNNFGLRGGFGLSKKVDLKLRYERLFLTGAEMGKNGSFNYVSLIPKVNFIPGKFSLFVPISLYRFNETYLNYGAIKTTLYSFAPHLIYTYTAASNKFDLSTTADVDFVWNPNEEDFSPNTWAGIKLGAGFSRNVRQWAVRPEAGLQLKPGVTGLLWYTGLSFQLMLPIGKPAERSL